jgi:phosphoenolpyruvate carboxykinase (ATP)
MILGQAMESSAGDPTKAGKIRTEFFYDPFVAGDKANHANLFFEIVKGLPHLQYYLINTGGVGEGEGYRKVRLEHTLAILDSLLRGRIEDWVDSPSGFKVPAAVMSVDDIYFHPEMLFSSGEFETKQKELNTLRHETIEQVGRSLNRRIRNVF